MWWEQMPGWRGGGGWQIIVDCLINYLILHTGIFPDTLNILKLSTSFLLFSLLYSNYDKFNYLYADDSYASTVEYF